MWDAAKSFGRAIVGGKVAGAKDPCPSGYQLVPGEGEVCIDDFVLDIDTGELITPAEAARRAASGLVWDRVAGEWVAPAELADRNDARARIEAGEVRDEIAGEWVTPEELGRRRRVRNALRVAARGRPINLDKPPRLDLPAAALMTIGGDGVARLNGVSAGAALATDAAAEVDLGSVLDVLGRGRNGKAPAISGPERREEDDKARRRLLILIALSTIIAVVALTRTAGRK